MSMISEQVKELRELAEDCKCENEEDDIVRALQVAADTIEALYAKLQSANMERSTEDFGGGWIPVSARIPEQKRCVDLETGYYWQSDKVLCSCFDEDEGKYETWIDYTIDGYWQTHEYYEGENFAWMPLPEPFGADTSKESNEVQYDKIMRVSAYLLERYWEKIWEEFEIEKTGDDFKDMFSMLKIFDEIYKREKEKYPLMWYEYCVCGNGNVE